MIIWSREDVIKKILLKKKKKRGRKEKKKEIESCLIKQRNKFTSTAPRCEVDREGRSSNKHLCIPCPVKSEDQKKN